MGKEALICPTFFNKLTTKHIQEIHETAYVKSFGYQKILLNLILGYPAKVNFGYFLFGFFTYKKVNRPK
ncbi:hypothetical protein SAMN05878482_106357 [Peribacillus simplex]|uniref:Uncharacterized protein n=1 Tax=Peribacillus simplex TaxID=1478 RepID=A0A9X8RCE6_9BACI|nr:hypothetical protein SAMN05878482_106357 [Peribacillus simplex]